MLELPVTGWVQDGRMYVFGVDRGSSSKTTSLWHVSLDAHATGWQQIIVVGNGAAPRIKGQVSTSWSEGAASYNPVSRKAYVFGSWNVHFNELTIAADSRQLQSLEGRYWCPSAAALCVYVFVISGFNISAAFLTICPCLCSCQSFTVALLNALRCRYYNLLLEFDVAARTMRAVKNVSKDGSPDKRAQCLIAVYSLPSSSGSDCHHVVRGYGYTTFNPVSQTYQAPHAMADIWRCTLLADDAAASCEYPLPCDAAEVVPDEGPGGAKLGPGQMKLIQVRCSCAASRHWM